MGAGESLTAFIRVLGSAAHDETDLMATDILEWVEPARGIHQQYWDWLFHVGRKPKPRKDPEDADPQAGIPSQRWTPLIPMQIPRLDEKEFIEARRNSSRIMARQLRTKTSQVDADKKASKSLDFRATPQERSIATGGVLLIFRLETQRSGLRNPGLSRFSTPHVLNGILSFVAADQLIQAVRRRFPIWSFLFFRMGWSMFKPTCIHPGMRLANA